MNTLRFLITHQLKNWIIERLRKPALLIIYVALFGLIIMSMTMTRDTQTASFLPEGSYAALTFVVFTGFLYANLRNALSRGTTVFGMEDVTFLFTSPLRPQTVLIYGIIRQMSVSLMIIFVTIFQVQTLRNLLGLSVTGIAGLILSFFLLALLSQTIALCVYALLSPSGRARTLKILDGVLIAMLVVFTTQFIQNPTIDGAVSILGHSMWRFVPLSGWLAGAAVSAQSGQFLYFAALLLCSLALGYAALRFIRAKNPDYYEDVLETTQETHDKKEAIRAGKGNAYSLQRRKVKTGRSGMTSGKGASAFFFKQLREQRREGFLFIDMKTLIYAFVSFIVCVPILSAGVENTSVALYTVLGTLLYSQLVFNVTSGRYTQEQLKPYLFLTPCSPRMKIVMCNLISVLKGTLDGLICCIGVCIFIQHNIIEGIFAGLTLGAATTLFVGGELIADLIIRESHSKTLNLIVYFLCELVIITPAVIIFVALLLIASPILAFLATIAYMLAAAFICVMLIGGVLHRLEARIQ